MNVIIFVDNLLGRQFNHRRQSRDRYLYEYLTHLVDPGPVYCNPYSKGLLPAIEMIAREDYLDQAGPDDWCLVELEDLESYEEQIEEMVVCRWNRDYPADEYLDVDLSTWHLVDHHQIRGSSHECITIDSYVRELYETV